MDGDIKQTCARTALESQGWDQQKTLLESISLSYDSIRSQSIQHYATGITFSSTAVQVADLLTFTKKNQQADVLGAGRKRPTGKRSCCGSKLLP